MNEGDISNSMYFRLSLGDIEIPFREIDADDAGVWEFLGDGEGEKAGSAGKVEDFSGSGRELSDDFFLPEPVDPESAVIDDLIIARPGLFEKMFRPGASFFQAG